MDMLSFVWDAFVEDGAMITYLLLLLLVLLPSAEGTRRTSSNTTILGQQARNNLGGLRHFAFCAHSHNWIAVVV